MSRGLVLSPPEKRKRYLSQLHRIRRHLLALVSVRREKLCRHERVDTSGPAEVRADQQMIASAVPMVTAGGMRPNSA